MHRDRVKDEMMRRAEAWGAEPTTAPAGAQRPSDTLLVSGDGPLVAGAAPPRPPTGGGSSSGMEGPLPAEVRAMIHANCTGETAEQAELYARRLLSTHRRVRVYREELSAANEELEDLRQLTTKHHLVSQALRDEIVGIDEKIQQLLNERHLCEVQLQQEAHVVNRHESKKEEAERRVNVLRTTIDNIARETQKGHLLLRQLVPQLQIENYCS